jgi:hypothetical protein
MTHAIVSPAGGALAGAAPTAGHERTARIPSDSSSASRGLFNLAPWVVVRTPLLPVTRIHLTREPRSALQDPNVVRALAIGCPDLLDSQQRPSSSNRDRGASG